MIDVLPVCDGHRFIAPIFVLIAPTPPAVSADPLVGRSSVIDGDTLYTRGARVRLHGIDALESAQFCQNASGKPHRCRQAAALALSDRIGEATVS